MKRSFRGTERPLLQTNPATNPNSALKSKNLKPKILIIFKILQDATGWHFLSLVCEIIKAISQIKDMIFEIKMSYITLIKSYIIYTFIRLWSPFSGAGV